MKKIKLTMVFLCLSIFSLFGFSKNLDEFVNTLDEQEKAVSWLEYSNPKVDSYKAQAIIASVYAHSVSNELDPRLVLAIIKTESNFITSANSKDGSKGLMQVMARVHKDKIKGRNIFDINTSIEVGTIILKDCVVKHNSNLLKALNCYSGGGSQKYYNKVNKNRLELVQSLIVT